MRLGCWCSRFSLPRRRALRRDHISINPADCGNVSAITRLRTFPAAMMRGLATDRGGALGRGTMVARDYDLPAVVGFREPSRSFTPAHA